MNNRYGARRGMTKKSQTLYIIVGAIMIAVALSFSIISSFNDHTYTATVNDKERVLNNNNSYYLIFCKDNEGNYYELQNTDSLFRWKFDSSNVYNRIEVGKTYRFTVVGYRINILSMYENIIEFEEVQE